MCNFNGHEIMYCKEWNVFLEGLKLWRNIPNTLTQRHIINNAILWWCFLEGTSRKTYFRQKYVLLHILLKFSVLQYLVNISTLFFLGVKSLICCIVSHIPADKRSNISKSDSQTFLIHHNYYVFGLNTRNTKLQICTNKIVLDKGILN